MTTNINRPNWNFYDEILEKADIEPFIDCMTCGKCVGDCIAAKNSDFNFRRIIQKILNGDRESLINGNEIWKCFLCGLCTIKCPKKIQIKKLILLLRKFAIKSGKGYKFLKYISNLPKSFSKKGLIFGRINENLREKLGLSKEFKLSDKTLKELAYILETTGQKKSIREYLNDSTIQSA
ncbi:MAG: 4Fe-4S dicluster domain-containing protein [Promethearchaeota archaeon]